MTRSILIVLCMLYATNTQALGLKQAYELALANDPTLQAEQQQHAAAQEHRNVGRAGLLPSLSWQYSTSRSQSEVWQGAIRTERDYRSYAATLSLSQPLLDFEAMARYRQGQAQTAMADERWRGQSAQLLVRVLRSYSQALLAGERLELGAARQRALVERLRLNQRLLAGGEGTRTDVLETQARLSLADAELIEALDLQAVALDELQGMLGINPEVLRPLAEHLPITPLLPAQFEHWRGQAQANNWELASKRHGLDVAAHEVRRQRAGHLPKVNLFANNRQTRSDSESTYEQRYDTNSIGVQVSVPLFAGGAVMASTRQASRQLSQAQYELDALTASTFNELRRHFNARVSGAARVRAYRLAVESARARVHATRQSVKGGERINLDVLDAEQQLYTSQRELAEARHAWLLADVQLRYLAGGLGEDDVVRLDGYFRH
nr:TolC family outer membrane protein [Pseudomonas sp. PIA16]